MSFRVADFHGHQKSINLESGLLRLAVLNEIKNVYSVNIRIVK